MTKSVISESHGFYMLSFLRNSPSFLAEWLCHFTFPWAMDEWTSFSRQCLMVCVTICDVSHPGQCVWPLRWFCSALPSWRMMLSIFSLCAPCLSFLVKCSSRLPVFWVGCPENYAEKEEPVLKVNYFCSEKTLLRGWTSYWLGDNFCKPIYPTEDELPFWSAQFYGIKCIHIIV